LAYHFPEAHEALEAYKVGCHRHLPEIEQELSALAARAAKRRATGDVHVVFTPHLVPMNRGILSTAYGRLLERHDAASLRDLYRDFYKNEPFVRVCEGEDSPNPRHLKGANACHINVYVERGNWAVTVAAIDNLVKGAAGQAIQAMNLMVGLPETQGLLAPGVYP
jgi:N-acetyl-gamma-glutamyl-phosphate reductase